MEQEFVSVKETGKNCDFRDIHHIHEELIVIAVPRSKIGPVYRALANVSDSRICADIEYELRKVTSVEERFG